MKNLEKHIKTYGERVRKIYEGTEDKVLKPGYYEVTETDYGGMREEVEFTLKITKPINMKELAIKLIVEKNYLSPWNDLRVRPYTPKEPKMYTI